MTTMTMSACQYQACQEPQWGLEKHSHSPLPPKKLSWGPYREKIFEFFLKWCILMYFCISEQQQAPKRRGAWGSLSPYPTLSTGLCVTI